MELKTPLLKFLLTLTHLRVILCDTVYTGKEEKLEPLFKSAATEFIHHEVVTPVIFKNNRQLVSTFNQGGHHDAITIKINTTDNKLILDLKRNRNLFSKAYIEKSFTNKEKYQIKRPHHKKLQRHCFYHGHLRGVKHSMVALSTCQGISGYIHNGVEVFHIEPAFDIDKRSHRLYKDADSAQSSFTCGAHKYGHSTRLNETRQIQHKNVVLKRMKRRVRKPYDANVNTRYVEMYIVNDFRTFDSNGRSLAVQIHHTQNIINIVSRLYQPFNIYIALTGIENWTAQDLFIITNEADSTLENFLHYRKSRINPKHHNDNAQLITGTTFANGVVGKAIKGTICTFQYSGGVNLNLATAGQTAATIAHELGHNFGMDHDNYTVCQCKEDKCIMAATSGGSTSTRVNTPSRWSSCSMLSLQEAFEMGMDYCLRNKPESLYKGPVCGNGFTEEGEECDCGLLEECKNKCCNATTCRLSQGSTCATGACCDLDGCKPKPAATLCRPAAGECDLSEYCWGNNPYCPDDVYLEDGTDCSKGQSYCYNGTCKTHTGQCKLLWGGTGRVSDPVCFKHLNTNGSKHGNCGYNWTTGQYESCQRDDVMCGLLHCVHQNEKLMFWKDNLAHATPATFLTIGASTYICRGAILDVGLDMPDPGMVPDGAKCEDKKVCINHKCTPLSHLNSPKCTAGCSGRGQCNSRGHCHCEEGFGAPICNIAGNGGSIDSGPINISDDKSLLIGLLVFFLVICPLLGLGAFIAYHFRDSLKAAWHQSFSQRHKGQSRPLRPQRPPPKREPQTPSFVNTPVVVPPPATANTHSPPYKDSPPAYANLFGEKNRPLRPKPAARNNNRNISGPTLTDSTHAVTKTHVQSSPVASHVKTVPNPPPKPPTKQVKQSNSQPMNVPQSSNAKKIAEKNDTPSDSKSKFGPIFKMPSFARSQDKEKTPKTPKQEIKKQEEAPAANIVRKRELTKEISSPVLISTTDRRSKHLVKLENLKVNVPQEDDSNTLSPPIPPHIKLKSNESENTKKNCPLPPRPESDCAVEVETNRKKSRKSETESPSMNKRQPPAPPTFAKVNNTESTLQSMTDVLSTLDDIQLELPDDVYVNETDSPKVMSKKPHNMQVKNIKPKPKTPISKSSSDSIQKKPMLPTKASAGKTKSDPKTALNNHARPGVKGNQSATSKHGSSQSKPGSSRSNIRKTGKKSAANTAEKRKDSTDSLDDGTDEGVASVSGLTKMFEGQKKPLLSGDKAVKSTQGENKAPMTPPKPTHGAKPVKQIRSVNV